MCDAESPRAVDFYFHSVRNTLEKTLCNTDASKYSLRTVSLSRIARIRLSAPSARFLSLVRGGLVFCVGGEALFRTVRLSLTCLLPGNPDISTTLSLTLRDLSAFSTLLGICSLFSQSLSDPSLSQRLSDPSPYSLDSRYTLYRGKNY